MVDQAATGVRPNRDSRVGTATSLHDSRAMAASDQQLAITRSNLKKTLAHRTCQGAFTCGNGPLPLQNHSDLMERFFVIFLLTTVLQRVH